MFEVLGIRFENQVLCTSPISKLGASLQQHAKEEQCHHPVFIRLPAVHRAVLMAVPTGPLLSLVLSAIIRFPYVVPSEPQHISAFPNTLSVLLTDKIKARQVPSLKRRNHFNLNVSFPGA